MTTSAAPVLLPIDVAIVDPDLLWRVEYMNAVKGVTVKEYAALVDAIEAMAPAHPVVVVLGPNCDDDAWASLPDVRSEHRAATVIAVHDAVPPEALTSTAGGRALVSRVLEPGTDPHVVAEAVAAALPERDATRRRRSAPGGGAGGTGADGGVQLPKNLIVFTAAKAGEGVTTAAANFAAELARRPNLRVAVVDADPHFGDLGMAFSLRQVPPLDARHAPVEPSLLEGLISAHESSGLLVARMPAMSTESVEWRYAVLLELLGALAGRADVVVVDAPLDMVVGPDLPRAAAAVLLVTTERTSSVKNAMIAAREVSGAPFFGALVNGTGRHTSEADLTQVERAVNVPVLGHLPFDARIERGSHKIPPHVLVVHPSRYTKVMRTVVEDYTKRAPILL